MKMLLAQPAGMSASENLEQSLSTKHLSFNGVYSLELFPSLVVHGVPDQHINMKPNFKLCDYS